MSKKNIKKDALKNKGDISEYYVLLKLLNERKLNAVSGAGKSVEIDIKEILWGANEQKTRVSLEQFNIQKLIQECETSFAGKQIPLSRVPEMKKLMERFPRSSAKPDLYLKLNYDTIHDEPYQGFSIKSFVGARPTLLNVSGQTRFKFKVNKKIKLSRQLSTHEIVKKYVRGNNLKFVGVVSDTFKYNLEWIDSKMPELLSELILDGYRVGFKSFDELLNMRFSGDKLELVKNKVGELLYQAMAGMRPGKKILEKNNLDGGLIILNRDRSVELVSTFGVLSVAQLKQKLLSATRIEEPDLDKHSIGSIYKKGDAYYIDLGLQIRFQSNMKF